MNETVPTEQPAVVHERVSRFKVLGIAAIGGLISLGIQAYGNDKAADKIATAENCAAAIPAEQKKIGQAFVDCVEAGLDGDGKITDVFDVGDPVSDINFYIELQQEETDFKPWAAVVIAVGTGLLGYLAIAISRSGSEPNV